MRQAAILLWVVAIVGCSSTSEHSALPNDPYYAPVIEEMPRHKIVNDGAIFQADMANSLYSDVKARRVGDIITVMLQETTSATKSAGTSTSRETEVIVDPLLGLNGGPLIGGNNLQLDIGAENEFIGDSSANQSNNLRGSISVTVLQVLPNQNLVVRGEKWLTLNNGDEYIRLTGIVRPADVSPDNEVMSTKVANARIQYSGTGTFASAQEHGWLGKFFASEWWPF